MSNAKCPICKKNSLHTVKGDYRTSFIESNNQSRELVVRGLSWDECSHCGEAFLDDAASQKIEAMRRRALDRLSPEQIKDFRNSLRKSQTEMALLLGLGEKTYSRWESGAYIQNTALDYYLRLLIGNPSNIELLENITANHATSQIGIDKDDLTEKKDTVWQEALQLTLAERSFSNLYQDESLIKASIEFTELLVTGKTFEPYAA